MKPSAKKSSKVKTGMAVFLILCSAAGAGVYAHGEPESATPNAVAPAGQEQGATLLAKKEQLVSVPAVKTEAGQDKSSRKLMRPPEEKQTTRDQACSLSDSQKGKILFVMALWSTKP